MVRTKLSSCCLWAIISFLCYAVVPAPYRQGDVMLGGLFSIHQSQGTSEGKCGKITKEVANAQAMIFAIDKINNDSNLLSNISLGYDIRDYCESIENATRITYELLRDKCSVNTTLRQLGEGSIVALIGPSFSSTAIFIAGILRMLNVSSISGSTTSPELTSHAYKNFYRTVAADTYSAKAVADIIAHFNWTYVAAIGVDDSFGRNAMWSLVNEAKNKNGSFCVALTDFIPHNTQITKAKEIVTKFKRQENIRVIIAWLYGTIKLNFFKEVAVQNLSERVWILSNGPLNLYESGFLSADFSPLHGSIQIEPHNFQDAGFKEYLKTILVRYEANKENIPEWWHDTATLIENCSLAKDSPTQHGENHQKDFCVKNIINDVYSPYVPYVIDAVYSVAHALHISTQDSSRMAIDGQRKPYLNLNEMQSLLSRVNFTGLTGNIFFDEFGDRQSAYYDIVNFQQETENDAMRLKRVIVGSWHDREGLQLGGTIRWNSKTGRFPKSDCLEQCSAGTRKSTTSPCCWQCIRCPRGTINSVPGDQTCTECPRGKRSNEARTACEDLPLANFHYSSPGGIAVLSFGALGMIATLVSFAVICRFWNTPIVKACNRGPSLALLSLIILMLSITFINLFGPTDAIMICKIIYPWRYITYSLCLSLLLVKVLRISSAFQIPLLCGYKITSLTNRMQAVIVVTLQAFLLIVLLIWLHFDPPFTMEQIYPEQYTLIHCKAYSTAVGKILFSLACSFLLIKMLLCAFCSFKVRNVPENFSEAKRIAFSMYMFLISLLAYYAVKFSMEGWYVTVVDCVTTLLSAYGFLVCIFLPKIYIILYKPELNTSANVRQEVTHFSFGPRFVRESPAFKSSTQQSQT